MGFPGFLQLFSSSCTKCPALAWTICKPLWVEGPALHRGIPQSKMPAYKVITCVVWLYDFFLITESFCSLKVFKTNKHSVLVFWGRNRTRKPLVLVRSETSKNQL
jgi:hypothetical protein